MKNVYLCCVLKSDDDTEESGSGSDDNDQSGSGADFSHRLRSFHSPPEFDYGISFDIFSRPPVEVVTRRLHGDGGGRVTAGYPVSTARSSRGHASLELMSLLVIVTMCLCRRHHVVVAETRSISTGCFTAC